ncbi:MAG: thrombospondin type 3 repeat-containing protein, partial [Kofleriaceae bacterium]
MRSSTPAAVLGALVVAGCDVVFNLARPPDAMVPIDAMVDGDPRVDTDGDTLFDDVDNCREVPNVDQHDEDSDQIGDVCDNCPHRSSSAPLADQDGDGVGDLCDPSTTPGDVLALYTFADLAGWSESPIGVFSVVDDRLRFASGAFAKLTTDVNVQQFGYVEIAYRYTNLSLGGGGIPYVGVALGVDSGASLGVLCWTDATDVQSRLTIEGMGIAAEDYGGRLETNVRYVLRIAHGEPQDGDKTSCAREGPAMLSLRT